MGGLLVLQTWFSEHVGVWGFPPAPWVLVAGAGLAGSAAVAGLCPWQPGVLLGDLAASSFGGDGDGFWQGAEGRS